MNEYQRTVQELLEEIDAQSQRLYRLRAVGAYDLDVERELAGTRERLAEIVSPR